MRSNLVFTARSRVSNPFLLCHFVRLATKAFHKNGVAVPETINKILTAVGKQDCAAPDPKALVSERISSALARADLTNLELARSAFANMGDLALATP